MKQITKPFLLVLTILACLEPAIGQQTFTLSEVVTLARENSIDAKVAKHRFMGNYWRHRNHKAQYLPHLELRATAPNLNRSISPITFPDGTDAFVRRSLASSSATLSVSQTIGLTGGQVFVTSSLERIDLFGQNRSVSYLANPVTVGFFQPLFGFNAHSWARKIEPMIMDEAHKEYVENLENIAVKATGLFFDLLAAQKNLEVSQANLLANDTLFSIARMRFEIMTISKTDLLQMELNLLNSQAAVEQAKFHHEMASFALGSFLNLDRHEEFHLLAPSTIPDLEIDVDMAINQAKRFRADLVRLARQKMEAEREVSKAKANSRININLNASFGLTQTAAVFGNAYRNPLDNQQVRLGITVPILDWGVSKSRVQMAESQRDLIITNSEQELANFEREIFVKVKEFNNLRLQLKVTQKAEEIALKRYQATAERFLAGRVGIMELNMAATEKDRSQEQFLGVLRNYWNSYYQIRQATIFDFLTNLPIKAVVNF